MKIYRSSDAMPSPAEPSAVAIGNFDGVHRGHARILKILCREGRARGLRTSLLTFSPHPERVFGKGRIAMIQTLDERLETLALFDLDAVCVQPFHPKFAALPAAEFVRRIIVRSLGARLVIIGPDFRFGRGRRGSRTDLARLGRRYGFAVRVVPPAAYRGVCISSSLIRELLAAGRVERANALLGRPYAIEGDVIAGAGRGCGLGFPTANIATPNEIEPPGVFVTTVEIRGRSRPSVTNVGTRPTFGPGDTTTIETHIIGCRGSLYGESVRLRFHKRIRGERTFAGRAELQNRIRADISAAREFFAARPDMV
jgi:riboflavin kinase/FMN adenylyltransferase